MRLILFLTLVLCNSLYANNDPVKPAEDNKEILIFGVAPFMSSLALVKRMAPLRDYLSDKLGYTIVLETATQAEEFMKRTINGRYDFVMTSPTFALLAMDTQKFNLIASQSRELTGKLIVLMDSPYNNLKDLEGKIIGAPPRVGFLGQLAETFIASLGMNEAPQIKYFHSHNDAISALRRKEIDATLIAGFMDKTLAKKGVHVRTLVQTPDFPGMSILTGVEMNDQTKLALKKVLIEMSEDVSGLKVLQEISFPPFEHMEVKELERVRPYLPKAPKD